MGKLPQKSASVEGDCDLLEFNSSKLLEQKRIDNDSPNSGEGSNGSGNTMSSSANRLDEGGEGEEQYKIDSEKKE